MSPAVQRSIVRWVHILFGLPLVGVVYGPPAETEPYRYLFKYVFVPAIALSGFWLWKGHVVARLLRKKSA